MDRAGGEVFFVDEVIVLVKFQVVKPCDTRPAGNSHLPPTGMNKPRSNGKKGITGGLDAGRRQAYGGGLGFGLVNSDQLS